MLLFDTIPLFYSCYWLLIWHYLSGSSFGWTSSYKYLGVTLLPGPQFKIDTDVIRRKFYASANTVFANSFHQDDIVLLHLVESYCLPVLQYCCPAIKLNNAQINEINACWNTMYRRIFRFHKWESVKTFICGLGRLDLNIFMQWLV